MAKMILVTGGRGNLARKIVEIDPTIDAPGREKLDFSRSDDIDRYCAGRHYDVIIHAGAVTNKFDEDVDEEYVRSNIIGTANVVLWAKRHNVRLVYVSSDYVYPGERGGYSEESVLHPVNRYAISKLGGELAVQLYRNSLIIRTSFYSTLRFQQACTDQYSSRLPIAEAARAIYDLALRDDVRGIINVGTKAKRSLFEIVKGEFNPSVQRCTRADIRIPYILPPDSSMDTSTFHRITETSLKESKTQTRCRVCDSDKLFEYLSMGATPLANSYITKQHLSEPEFREELAIQVCLECGLSQLTKVVHPDLMFRNYLYVSSTTQTFRDHCRELAETSIRVSGAKSGELVLDVASNDGCLLAQFHGQGMNVLGVDPAENLAAEANANGIRTLCAYWSSGIALDIVSRFGSPRIITATNVFAHVDDLREFIKAVDACLARRGIFVIEFPYLMDFISKNEFDTAYHEHLSYISIHPMVRLAAANGMEVFDIDYFKDLHGGTVRVFVSRKGDYAIRESVGARLKDEAVFGIASRAPYESFASRVLKNKSELRSLIEGLRRKEKTIWAYGASAKGNTLMNFFQLTHEDVPVVIDDNPKKWGHYTPGSHMRITGIDELKSTRIDYLLLLAWNFQAEIIHRCKAAGYRGDYILPVPVPTVIAGDPES